jgi:hypothetical protein
MPVGLQIVPHQTYLHVTLSGDVTLAGAKDAVTQIIQSAWEHRLPRILIDWRDTGMHRISTLDRFEGTSYLAQRVAELRARGLTVIRIAHVTQVIRDDAEVFSETVAANRGIITKITTSIAEALAWLGVEPIDDS